MIMKKNVMLTLMAMIFLLVSCKGDYDYEVAVNEQITIDLEATGHDGGYSWCWDKHDDLLDSVSHVFTPYEEDVVSSSGMEHWTFHASHKGTTVIRLDYKRPWNDSVLDSREYRVKVND